MTQPQEADFFRVPLLNGQVSFGQVIAPPKDDMLAALSCRIAAPDQTPRPFVPIDIVAFVRIKPGHIIDGTWTIAGFDMIPRFGMFFDIAHHAPDLPPHDPVIIEAFCNAWHGLYPWDAFGDLFDQIAANGVNKTRVPV